MKLDGKSFAAGAVFMLASTAVIAYAADGIQSAVWNENRVVFNDRTLDLSRPMISVVAENESSASNYMPVRGVLSAMGFGVAWDGNSSVLVFTPEYLEASPEWIDFQTVEETLAQALNPDGSRRDWGHSIHYIPERQTVHVLFDARHEWDIPTAAVDGRVYVERRALNNFYNLYNLPPILTSEEASAAQSKREEFHDNPEAFVSLEAVFTLVNLREEAPLAAVVNGNTGKLDLQAATPLSEDGDQKTVASLEIFAVDKEGWGYVRKREINPVLEAYGCETLP